MPFALAQNQMIVSSPLIQSKEGVFPAEVECKQGLLLILKKSDYSPACVNPDSVGKLVNRGWGLFNVTISWFAYYPIECKEDPYGGFHGNNSDSSTYIKNGFKEKGITLLDLWQYFPSSSVYVTPPCGSHTGEVDYFGVTISNMSAFTMMGLEQINSTQVCVGTHCGSFHKVAFFCPRGYTKHYQGYQCVKAPEQVLIPTPPNTG